MIHRKITSSDEYIDVSELTSYDSNTYRVYNGDGTYESVKAENGKVHNTSKSEVTIVVPGINLNLPILLHQKMNI